MILKFIKYNIINYLNKFLYNKQLKISKFKIINDIFNMIINLLIIKNNKKKLILIILKIKFKILIKWLK